MYLKVRFAQPNRLMTDLLVNGVKMHVRKKMEKETNLVMGTPQNEHLAKDHHPPGSNQGDE